MTQTHSAKLDIKFSSFSFNQHASLKENDTIRVSITAVPDNNKKSMLVPVSLLGQVNQIITLDVSSITKKIIVVFRKATESKSGHIIGSTIIHKEDLPDKTFISNQLGFSDVSQAALQTLDIFEPNHYNKQPPFKSESNDSLSSTERKIIGAMKYQISLSVAILTGHLDSGAKVSPSISKAPHKNFGFSIFQKKTKDSHTYNKLYA